MNEDLDDMIDRLLRDDAPAPAPDAGFCADLIERLPPRRRQTLWPLVTGVLAGTLACWFSMRSAPVVLAGWHDWVSGDLTPSALVLLAAVAGLVWLALAWALAEAREPAL